MLYTYVFVYAAQVTCKCVCVCVSTSLHLSCSSFRCCSFGLAWSLLSLAVIHLSVCRMIGGGGGLIVCVCVCLCAPLAMIGQVCFLSDV